MTQKISEQTVLLGRRQSLVGIVARAVTGTPPDNPAVIILNTGIIHRVGHHRMYVTMSRALAAAGHTVLRFDFSGIGDSDPRTDGLAPVESCLADIKDAIDWLERDREVSRVILIGLCSGADYAILYGHTDARVVALVLMDPSIPATARYYLHIIIRRLMRLRAWNRVVTGRSRILRMWLEHLSYALRPKGKYGQITLQNLKFHSYLEQCYQGAVDRRIEMLAVLTEDSTRQTYRMQMIDAFPNVSFGNQLKLELFSGSDHSFSREADRSRLNQLILGWINSMNYRDLSLPVRSE